MRPYGWQQHLEHYIESRLMSKQNLSSNRGPPLKLKNITSCNSSDLRPVPLSVTGFYTLCFIERQKNVKLT